MKNIYECFTHKMAAKATWHWNYITVTMCIVYTHCVRDNKALTIVTLQRCFMDINQWMSANRLKLNRDKTELIWTGTKYSVTVGNASFLSLRLGADVFYQVNMFVCSDWSSQLISASRSMFKTSAQHAFAPSPSTATHPALTVYSVLFNTRARFHDVPGRLQ